MKSLREQCRPDNAAASPVRSCRTDCPVEDSYDGQRWSGPRTYLPSLAGAACGKRVLILNTRVDSKGATTRGCWLTATPVAGPPLRSERGSLLAGTVGFLKMARKLTSEKE